MKELRGRCSEGRLLGATNSSALVLSKSVNHTHHIAATCEEQVLYGGEISAVRHEGNAKVRHRYTSPAVLVVVAQYTSTASSVTATLDSKIGASSIHSGADAELLRLPQCEQQ